MANAPVQDSRPAMLAMSADAATLAFGDVYITAAYRRRDIALPAGSDPALPSVRVQFVQGFRGGSTRGGAVARGGIAGGWTGNGLTTPGAHAGAAAVGQLIVPCVPGGGAVAGGWDGSTGLDRGAVALGDLVRVAQLGAGDEFIVPGKEIGMPQRGDAALRVTRVLGCDGAVWLAEVSL